MNGTCVFRGSEVSDVLCAIYLVDLAGVYQALERQYGLNARRTSQCATHADINEQRSRLQNII